MKKTLALAILGVAATTTAFGQGSIIFDNYVAGTYNQVVWGPGVPGQTAGTAVTDPAIQLQLLYAEGVVTDIGLLIPGVTVAINPAFSFDPGNGAGEGGYFSGPTQLLSTWGAGDTFTFAVEVVTPGYRNGTLQLWQETANIRGTTSPQTGFENFPGATVVLIPEPSTFALAGLGAAALLIFRRRA
jgi:hypothetical protein